MPNVRGEIRYTRFLFRWVFMAVQNLPTGTAVGPSQETPDSSSSHKKNCSRNSAIIPAMIVISIFLLNQATSTAITPASNR